MGEDLKRLISVRGAYRGHCTRAIKAANEIKESYSPYLDTLEDVFEGLCSRIKRLSLQKQKIELAVPEDKIEEEITQTLEYIDDLMGEKNRTAKFLRDAKAQVKDGAYYCCCAYVLRISRYSDFLSPMLTNTGIFLRGLKLSG